VNCSKQTPLLLALDGQSVHCLFVGVLLLVRWLDKVDVFVADALLLRDCLPQDGLVPVVALFLSLDVVDAVITLPRLKESLVFVCVDDGLLLDLLDFAFGLLFELVSQGHKHILFPDGELTLQRRMVDRREERTRLIRQVRQALQLHLHLVDGFLALFAVHAVEIEVLLAHRLVLILDEGRAAHINERPSQVLLSQLLGITVVVVVLLGFVRRFHFLLELFDRQGHVRADSSELLAGVAGHAVDGPVDHALRDLVVVQSFQVVPVVHQVLAHPVDLIRVARHLLVENTRPHQSV